ncbi:hypothetical protein V8C42DRAFT_303992 [Trichoderma barbatum]
MTWMTLAFLFSFCWVILLLVFPFSALRGSSRTGAIGIGVLAVNQGTQFCYLFSFETKQRKKKRKRKKKLINKQLVNQMTISQTLGDSPTYVFPCANREARKVWLPIIPDLVINSMHTKP